MAKPKSKLERKSLIPPSIKAIFVAVLIALTWIAIASAQSSRIETTQDKKTSIISSEKKEAVVEPQKRSDEKPAEPAPETTPTIEEPKVDPNGCEAQGMWWRADNYECIPKPQPVAAVQSSVAAAPATSGGSGSCEAEIAKYNWNHGVALAVARAESGLNPGSLNNNPATGDYSVGCFQINIYGANAASRPSEAALKNAATNVAFAHRIYVSNGSSFLGQWGVCRSEVSCY